MNGSTFTMKIGNKTYIVSAKQSDTAKKTLEEVLRDMCKREVLSDSFAVENSTLENQEKMA